MEYIKNSSMDSNGNSFCNIEVTMVDAFTITKEELEKKEKRKKIRKKRLKMLKAIRKIKKLVLADRINDKITMFKEKRKNGELIKKIQDKNKLKMLKMIKIKNKFVFGLILITIILICIYSIMLYNFINIISKL